MAKGESLTEKQRRWVEAYMGEAKGNGTEAARLAGYKGNRNTLSEVGHKMLKLDTVRAAIDERIAEDPLVSKRHDLLRFWSEAMRGEHRGLDRLKASEYLAKAYGMFTQKIDIKAEAKARVVFYVPDNGRGVKK